MILKPKQPITYVHDNLIFGRTLRDVHALYRLPVTSYAGLTEQKKIKVLEQLYGFAYRIGAPFQVLRVSRAWSPAEYKRRAFSTMADTHGHADLWDDYLDGDRAMLARRSIVRPEVYLAVQLTDPAKDLGGALQRGARRGVRGLFDEILDVTGALDARGITRTGLDRLSKAQERAHERVFAYLDCEPATTDELQWLVRRAYTRGLGEPLCDELWQPSAMVDLSEGGARFFPDTYKLLRLHDSEVCRYHGHLRVRSELGVGYQTNLVVGELPREAEFPSREVEHMFSPLEQLDFPVDATLTVDWIPNSIARTKAQRAKIDADVQEREEMYGDHGASAETVERQIAARQLEADLGGSHRPPMLFGALTLSVGAPDTGQLDQRVERLRQEYGAIKLHCPPGEQDRLFMATLPAQPFPLRDFKDWFELEQFGAMVPIACNHAGSEVGPYIGYTRTGSRQPICLDTHEASRDKDKPPTIWISASLGGGKTVVMQLLEYHSFLQGSLVCDIDPKGDHNLDRLPGVAEHYNVVELAGTPEWRGTLDPLRISAPEERFDATVDFLSALLPRDNEAWKTEVKEAVKEVLQTCEGDGLQPTMEDVLDVLEHTDSSPAAHDAARSLRVYCDMGLAQLGFSTPDQQLPDWRGSQVTSLRIRNLPRPQPGTAREEYSERERIGAAVLQLVCLGAMKLMSGDTNRHKVFGMDEAWFFEDNPAGRRLLEQMARWGRSENCTLILGSHNAGDAEHLDNLVGIRMVGRMMSRDEATQALRLMHLDDDDEDAKDEMLGLSPGEFWLRDLDGQVAKMKVDVRRELLDRLRTTPGHQPAELATHPAPAVEMTVGVGGAA